MPENAGSRLINTSEYASENFDFNYKLSNLPDEIARYIISYADPVAQFKLSLTSKHFYKYIFNYHDLQHGSLATYFDFRHRTPEARQIFNDYHIPKSVVSNGRVIMENFLDGDWKSKASSFYTIDNNQVKSLIRDNLNFRFPVNCYGRQDISYTSSAVVKNEDFTIFNRSSDVDFQAVVIRDKQIALMDMNILAAEPAANGKNSTWDVLYIEAFPGSQFISYGVLTLGSDGKLQCQSTARYDCGRSVNDAFFVHHNNQSSILCQGIDQQIIRLDITKSESDVICLTPVVSAPDKNIERDLISAYSLVTNGDVFISYQETYHFLKKSIHQLAIFDPTKDEVSLIPIPIKINSFANLAAGRNFCYVLVTTGSFVAASPLVVCVDLRLKKIVGYHKVDCHAESVPRIAVDMIGDKEKIYVTTTEKIIHLDFDAKYFAKCTNISQLNILYDLIDVSDTANITHTRAMFRKNFQVYLQNARTIDDLLGLNAFLDINSDKISYNTSRVCGFVNKWTDQIGLFRTYTKNIIQGELISKLRNLIQQLSLSDLSILLADKKKLVEMESLFKISRVELGALFSLNKSFSLRPKNQAFETRVKQGSSKYNLK